MVFTREKVMNDPTVHDLTKKVLTLSQNKDVVDRYYDVLLAAHVLQAEIVEALGIKEDKRNGSKTSFRKTI